MDSNKNTCIFTSDRMYDSVCDMNESTTCGDADEVSSLCSWATDQGDFSDADKFSAVGNHAIADQNKCTNNSNTSQPWHHDQCGVSNCVAVPWPVTPVYGTYMAAVPVMCYVVPQMGSIPGIEDKVILPGSWTDTTAAVPSACNEKMRCKTMPPKKARGEEPVCAFTSDSSADVDDLAKTTIILRNLPLECTRDMLLQLLDAEGFWGYYDFLHLPVDFQTKAGLGYALLNLVNHNAATCVMNHFAGFSRWPFPSDNVCTTAWNAPQQGLAAHIDRYRNSPLMHASVPEVYRPAIFENGVRVRFPSPTTKIRAPRIRHPKPGKA